MIDNRESVLIEDVRNYCTEHEYKIEVYNEQDIRIEADNMVFRWSWKDKAPSSYEMVLDRLEDFASNKDSYIDGNNRLLIKDEF